MAASGFEGYEKRLEVAFFTPSALVDPEGNGLRKLSRTQIDEIVSAAEATVVVQLSNDDFDSYVLSESSLFVYPYKIILKTCGTTMLLKSIPVLLQTAKRISLNAASCRYTRGAYMFPKEQKYPQGSFVDEVSYLDVYFDSSRFIKAAYELGDVPKWHIYSAFSTADVKASESVYTLEMCMTNLDRECASKFYKSNCATALEMTTGSGISCLLPRSRICEHAFDPCGYSMNSVEGNRLSTIHVTPEEGYSYASFEAMGYCSKDVSLLKLVNDVLTCFKPGTFSVALHASDSFESLPGSWGSTIYPAGYVCKGRTEQNVNGGMIVYYTFSAENRCPVEARMLFTHGITQVENPHDGVMQDSEEKDDFVANCEVSPSCLQDGIVQHGILQDSEEKEDFIASFEVNPSSLLDGIVQHGILKSDMQNVVEEKPNYIFYQKLITA